MMIKRLILAGALLVWTGQVFAQWQRPDLIRSNANFEPQRFGDGVLLHLVEGDKRMMLRDFEGAILAFDNAVVQAPNMAEAYLKRAVAKQIQGRDKEAAQDLQLAQRLNPYAADLYGVGSSLRRLRIMAFNPSQLLMSYPEAELQEYLQKLIAARSAGRLTAGLGSQVPTPEEMLPPADFRQLEAALQEWQSGEKGLALQRLENFVNQRPAEPLARILLAYLLMDSGREMPAELQLNQARQLDPKPAIVPLLLARMAAGRGRAQEAVQLLDQASRLDSNWLLPKMEKAGIWLLEGNAGHAVILYNQLIELYPGVSAALHWNRNLARTLSGDIPGAFDDLSAIGGKSTNPVYQLQAGNLYLLGGFFPEAIEAFSRALELDSDLGDAYFNRALARILAHNRSEACYDLRRSQELGQPGSTEKLSYFCAF